MSAALVAPTRVVVVDSTGPFPALAPVASGSTTTYRHARLFVWHDDRPAGSLDLEIGDGRSASDVGAAVHSYLEGQIGERPSDVPDQSDVADPTDLSDVTVVIATHDRPSSLIVCIESLLDDIEAGLSVIVVDSSPSDGAALEALTERFGSTERLTYVRVARPGLAVAHNVALELVETDLVMFTDDDVIVDRRWAAATVAAFSQFLRAVCVTGSILPAQLDTETQCLIEQSAGFDKGLDRRVFDTDEHRPDDPLFPFTAGTMGSGANMSFRTSFLRDNGGFDGALGAGSRGVGGDDLASFIDVVVSGHQLVYEPAAVVYHHHHRESPALRRQARGYGTGLTAAIVASVVKHPQLVPALARSVPRAIVYALSSDSPKNQRRPDAYPSELGRLELLGMATGPFAYVRSRLVGRGAVQHDDPIRFPEPQE